MCRQNEGNRQERTRAHHERAADIPRGAEVHGDDTVGPGKGFVQSHFPRRAFQTHVIQTVAARRGGSGQLEQATGEFPGRRECQVLPKRHRKSVCCLEAGRGASGPLFLGTRTPHCPWSTREPNSPPLISSSSALHSSL